MSTRLPDLLALPLEFECLRTPPPAARAPGKLLEVLYANLKTAGLPLGTAYGIRLLNTPDPTTGWPMTGERYRAELVLPRTEQARWQPFAEVLERCDFRGNFCARVGDMHPLDVNLDPPPEVPDELCLEFKTPLRFVREAGSPPWALTPTVLLDLIERRLSRLAGAPWRFDEPLQISLLTHCWRYLEHWRRSASHARRAPEERHGPGLHYLNGVVGPLYLRGDLAPLVLPLRLLARANLAAGGGAKAFGGHFVLHESPRPFFDHWLSRADRLEPIIVEHRDQLDADETWVRSARNDDRDDHRLAEHLARDLGSARYAPAPTRVWRQPKPAGGTREIEESPPVDRIVQRHLLQVLQPSLDKLHSDASHGFRPGRSVETVLRRVRAALQDGHRHVLRADIASFFASINHAQLETCLDEVIPCADRRTRHALMAWLATPRSIAGRPPLARSVGLPEGSPLSPLLSNLYLRPFDVAMTDPDWLYLRYVDDFIVLARSAEVCTAARARAESVLAELGLTLSAGKTRTATLTDGFTFVGEHFPEAAKPHQGRVVVPQRKPLVVLEPFTSLGVNGDALEQRSKGRPVNTVPLRRVSEMVVLAPSTLSTALLARLARFRVPLAIALDSGHKIGTLTPPSRDFLLIAHQHATWYEALSAADRRSLAIRLADRKIGNYETWAASRRRPGDATLAAELATLRSRLEEAVDANAVRGHEGLAARQVFAWLNARVRRDLAQHFTAPRRCHPQAPDRLNSLLSFGYYLLFTHLNALARAHGLNPYLGLLHDGRANYETLVADLQEPFRVHVDRLVLRLINRGEIGPNEFERERGQMRLLRPAARRFVEQFEAMLTESPGGLCIRDALTIQVRSLRATVTQGTPLWLYGWEQPGPARTEPAPSTLTEAKGEAQQGRR